MVRAKFRCMSTTRRIKDGEAVLKPVIAKNEDWPNGCEENAQFWDATPAGEMTLRYVSKEVIDVEEGHYYYIDMEEDPEGDWKLYKVARTEHQVEVQFGVSWDNSRPVMASANFDMTIRNDCAWPQFEGRHGTKWRVELTPAGAQSHKGCPYTDC